MGGRTGAGGDLSRSATLTSASVASTSRSARGTARAPRFQQRLICACDRGRPRNYGSECWSTRLGSPTTRSSSCCCALGTRTEGQFGCERETEDHPGEDDFSRPPREAPPSYSPQPSTGRCAAEPRSAGRRVGCRCASTPPLVRQRRSSARRDHRPRAGSQARGSPCW